MQTERNKAQEIRNDQSTMPENRILTWRIGNQEQARTVADYFDRV